jgi:hypothetical protein
MKSLDFDYCSNCDRPSVHFSIIQKDPVSTKKLKRPNDDFIFGHLKTRYLRLPKSPTVFGYCEEHVEEDDAKIWTEVSYEEALVYFVMES